VYMGRERKSEHTINPVNQREKIYSKKKKSIAVTIKTMMNVKGTKKRLLKMRNIQERAQNSTHTHTHTHTRNKVNKQKYILNQRKTSKQTNTQID
jgi:hypothetical protein